MSIAEQEARQTYPAEYQYDSREAYMCGRAAPPADVEVEAVARKLLWWDMAPAWEDVMPSEDCFWTLAEPEMRANYLRDAREMLEIARKAVNE